MSHSENVQRAHQLYVDQVVPEARESGGQAVGFHVFDYGNSAAAHLRRGGAETLVMLTGDYVRGVFLLVDLASLPSDEAETITRLGVQKVMRALADDPESYPRIGGLPG